MSPILQFSIVQSNELVVASQYGLQIALQCMKERCLQLQSRLSLVDRENLLLKKENQEISMMKHSIDTREGSHDIDRLLKQIIEQNKQKDVLMNHIHMLTTENKCLWSQLSLLTEASEKLATRLTKIVSKLNCYTKSSQNLKEVKEYDILSNNIGDMSLKLIDLIQERKTNLEKQCSEIFELRNTKSCKYDDGNVISDNGNEILTENLQTCKFRLLKVLSSLRNQNKSSCTQKVVGMLDGNVRSRSLDGNQKTEFDVSKIECHKNTFCPICSVNNADMYKNLVKEDLILDDYYSR